mgnify:CR=1 FL=1
MTYYCQGKTHVRVRGKRGKHVLLSGKKGKTHVNTKEKWVKLMLVSEGNGVNFELLAVFKQSVLKSQFIILINIIQAVVGHSNRIKSKNKSDFFETR